MHEEGALPEAARSPGTSGRGWGCVPFLGNRIELEVEHRQKMNK